MLAERLTFLLMANLIKFGLLADPKGLLLLDLFGTKSSDTLEQQLTLIEPLFVRRLLILPIF